MLHESVIEFKTLAEAELCRYCEITVIRGVPMFMVIVGRLNLRIQWTMKLGKQFDIDILANAVLEWPQLSGSAALGTIDKISMSIPFNGL